MEIFDALFSWQHQFWKFNYTAKIKALFFAKFKLIRIAFCLKKITQHFLPIYLKKIVIFRFSFPCNKKWNFFNVFFSYFLQIEMEIDKMQVDWIQTTKLNVLLFTVFQLGRKSKLLMQLLTWERSLKHGKAKLQQLSACVFGLIERWINTIQEFKWKKRF